MAERELIPRPPAPLPEPPLAPRCTVCGGRGWIDFDADKPCRSLGEAMEGAAPCPVQCASPLRAILVVEIGLRDGTFKCVDCGGVARTHWSGDLVCRQCAFQRSDEWSEMGRPVGGGRPWRELRERWLAGKRGGGDAPVAADVGAG